METCRTCAKCDFTNESTNWIDLFHSTIYQQDIQQIHRELNCWRLKISPDDGLPKKICADCFTKLCTISAFHIECEQAQLTLNTIFDKIDDIDDTNSVPDGDNCVVELNRELLIRPLTEELPNAVNSVKCNTTLEYANKMKQIEKCSDNNNNKCYTTNNNDDDNDEDNHIVDEQMNLENFIDIGNTIVEYSENKLNENLNCDENRNDEPQPFDVLLVEEISLDDLIEEDTTSLPTTVEKITDDNFLTKNVTIKDNGYTEKNTRINNIKNDIRPYIKDENMNFECKFCYKSANKPKKLFNNNDELMLHIEANHNEVKPYNCPFCFEEYADSASRTVHIRDQHVKKKYTCEVCGKRYTHPTNLKDHIEKYHSGKDFSCLQCNKSFYSQKSLKYHQNWHNTTSLLHCNYCERIFVNKRLLEDHENQHNGVIKRQYCPHCDKNFCNTKSLRYHLYRKHDGEKPHRCRFCTECFITYQDKRIHMLDKHSNNLTTHEKSECMHCHNIFVNINDLKEHLMNEHKKSQRKPLIIENNYRVIQNKRGKHYTGLFQCQHCPQRFNMKTALERHLVVHTAEGRPHECLKCKKRFKRPHDLTWHMKTHDIEKTNICDICGKGFALKYVLTQHKKSHEVIEKNFICEICGRSYYFEKSLRTHERTHTGRTYYTCDLCGETFVTYIKLKWHMNKDHIDENAIVETDEEKDETLNDEDIILNEELFDILN